MSGSKPARPEGEATNAFDAASKDRKTKADKDFIPCLFITSLSQAVDGCYRRRRSFVGTCDVSFDRKL